jgi:hypothetical protein
LAKATHDNSDLRLTHFCGTKNQPRLKAKEIDLAKGRIDFELVDVTNVSLPAAPFVHGLEVEYSKPDQLGLTFHFEAAGKKSDEHIRRKRIVKPTQGGSHKCPLTSCS